MGFISLRGCQMHRWCLQKPTPNTYIDTHKSNASSAATETEHHHGGDCSGQGAGRMICTADRGLLCGVCVWDGRLCARNEMWSQSVSAVCQLLPGSHAHTHLLVCVQKVYISITVYALQTSWNQIKISLHFFKKCEVIIYWNVSIKSFSMTLQVTLSRQ